MLFVSASLTKVFLGFLCVFSAAKPFVFPDTAKPHKRKMSVRLAFFADEAKNTAKYLFYRPAELHSAAGQRTEKLRKSLNANALILAILPSAFENSVPKEIVCPTAGVAYR